MGKMIVVNASVCSGCRICEMVCSIKHEGVVNPARSRIRVIQHESVLLDVPVLCKQCESPPCAAVCPTDAIKRDEKLNQVIIDYELCIGCKICVAACPFGAMGFDTKARKVINCDLCDGDPECVKFCSVKAIECVDDSLANLKKARAGSYKTREQVRQLG